MRPRVHTHTTRKRTRTRTRTHTHTHTHTHNAWSASGCTDIRDLYGTLNVTESIREAQRVLKGLGTGTVRDADAEG